MIALILAIMGFEALFTIGLLYYYEDKIIKLNRDYKELEEDFIETYNAYCNVSELASQYNDLTRKAEDKAGLYENAYESEHSAIHHQMKINEILDVDNQALKAQVKALKTENSALRNAIPIQYESSKWNGNEQGQYEMLIEL
jgi:lysyl-tRNA synthetase class II